MSFGGYEVKVSTGMPQKVATGFNKVFENMCGARYTPIAYLGSKVVNGTNHAVLCEQKLVVAEDVTSIVLVILNEKPGDVNGENFSIVEIDTLLSNGGKLGGLSINPVTDIPAEAKEVWDRHFAGFVGANNKPFALLATQVVRGGAYVFAVESTMIVSPTCMKAGDVKSVNLVKIYGDFSEVESVEVLRGSAAGLKAEHPKDAALDYAFTWSAKAGNLESPLGEWP